MARRRRAWLARRDFSELEARLPELRAPREVAATEPATAEVSASSMQPTTIGVELADSSVWARNGKPGLEWFGLALEGGRIAVCDMVVVELLWSARDIADFRATETALLACPWISIEPPDWDEARRIFRER